MGLSNQIYRHLIESAKEQRRPITVNFELTPICNLNCKMCYICSSAEEIYCSGKRLKTADEWLNIADELREMDTLFLLLTGGEVFLYPEFKKLYLGLYKKGFALTINTNATMIDENIVSWLKCYPPKCLSVSLYGASNETYEALCGRKNMFSRVDYALRLLKNSGLTVECKTIFTPLNVRDREACWDYVQNLKIPYETSSYSFPPDRKLVRKEQIRFTPEEAVKCNFECNRMMSDENGFKNNIVQYLKKYEDTKDIPGSEHRGLSCSATNSSCWITWEGHMTPCAILDSPYTLPFEKGVQNAWEELKANADKLVISSECSYCKKRNICTVCPAAAYAETGRIDGKSIYHCKMTDLTLEHMNQYTRGWLREKKNTKES